jgi:hypothetical protein
MSVEILLKEGRQVACSGALMYPGASGCTFCSLLRLVSLLALLSLVGIPPTAALEVASESATTTSSLTSITHVESQPEACVPDNAIVTTPSTTTAPPSPPPLPCTWSPAARLSSASQRRHPHGLCWVSASHRYAYFNIAKVASTSLKALVGSAAAGRAVQSVCDVHPLSGRLQSYRPHLGRGEYGPPELAADFFMFAFVRDPVRRFLSGFHTVAKRGALGGAYADSTRMPFVRVTHDDRAQLRAFLDDVRRNGGPWEEHTAPQTLYLRVSTSTADEAAATTSTNNSGSSPSTSSSSSSQGHTQGHTPDNTPHRPTAPYPPAPVPLALDFVGRVESFEGDWRRLEGLLLGRKAPEVRLQLPRSNPEERAAMPRPITVSSLLAAGDDDKDLRRLLQEVCVLYAQDFACLNYSLPRACADGSG